VARVFDSGDLRVAMKGGGTWTFNPECCTLLSEETSAAVATDADGGESGESSSENEDEDNVQISRTSPVCYCLMHPS